MKRRRNFLEEKNGRRTEAGGVASKPTADLASNHDHYWAEMKLQHLLCHTCSSAEPSTGLFPKQDTFVRFSLQS